MSETLNPECKLQHRDMRAVSGTASRSALGVHLRLLPEKCGIKAHMRLA